MPVLLLKGRAAGAPGGSRREALHFFHADVIGMEAGKTLPESLWSARTTWGLPPTTVSKSQPFTTPGGGERLPCRHAPDRRERQSRGSKERP